MTHTGEQQGSGKHATRNGTIWRPAFVRRRGDLGLLGALVMAVSLLGLGLGPAQAAPLAYITNGSSNDVSILDTATNTVIDTVPVGLSPFGVAVHPAGSFVYVANQNSDTVSVIKTATNTVIATVPVGRRPTGVAVHPAGTRVYVTNADQGFPCTCTVSVIDTVTNSVIATVPVGTRPTGVAVHPAGNFFYVGYRNNVHLDIFDTATNTYVNSVYMDNGLYGVAVHPAGTFVYAVTSGIPYEVAVISTATNTIVARVGVGDQPAGVAVHPAGSFVYVANQHSNSVSVIETATNTVVKTIAVGTLPIGVAVHPAGSFVYVANQNSNSVSVIDTATNTVVKTVEVGFAPRAFGRFIGPVALPLPGLTLALTGCTSCKAGDTFSVNATVKNPASKPVRVEVKAGVALPDGTRLNVWVVNDKHFEVSLAPGLDTSVEILSVTLPGGLPKGTWSYEGALIDPELGRTLARDVKPFTIQ